MNTDKIKELYRILKSQNVKVQIVKHPKALERSQR